MRRRRIWLLVVTLAAPDAARAAAADPDLSAPSVCAPPCADGEICVGTTCVVPDGRPAAPTRPRATTRPAPPPPPPGSAATTGPHPGGPPPPAHAPPPAQAPPSNPPPPGHAPPPGYQPPTYYYPPPQPLGWYYLPAPLPLPLPPKPPRLKRSFLALPYFGIHSYQNSEAAVYGPGVRFGSLVGGRLNDRLSLNADLTIDVSNVGYREYSIALAFAPLLQVPAGPLEIVVGPKVGLFVLHTEFATMGVTTTDSQQGVVFGISAGVFLPVSASTSMGVLLTGEMRRGNDTCSSISQGGVCASGNGSGLASIVGLTVAVLF